MPDRRWFEGQVVIITGASRGIGRATAVRFAEEGANLVLSATNEGALARVADECRTHGASVVAVAGDLVESSEPTRIVRASLDAFGRLDVVVNNAFWEEGGTVESVTPAGWTRTLDISLTAPMLLARAALPGLRKKGGVIVFVSSMRAIAAGHGMAAYETAKAGLLGLTRSIAIDYGQFGVRSVCITPGLVATERVQDWYQGAAWRQAAMDTVIPLGRPGMPEEIASVIAFVASRDGSYITGSTVWVDGGSVSGLPENAALELAERFASDGPPIRKDSE